MFFSKDNDNIIPLVYFINFPIIDYSFQVLNEDVYHTAVSIQSIIENLAGNSLLIFYIFHQYISEENINKIKRITRCSNNCLLEFIDITEFLLKYELYTANNTESYTFNGYTPYLKFIIPYILHHHEHLLYIDNNMIFNTDVSVLFKMHITDNSVACCNEVNHPGLFSTDLILINTKIFMNIIPENSLLKMINNTKKMQTRDKISGHLPPDQYFLNTIFIDNISPMSRSWNGKDIIDLKNTGLWANIYSVDIRYVLRYASGTEFFNEILNSLLEQNRSNTDRANQFGHNEVVIRNLRSSYSYRIGRLITYPPRIIIKCYQCYKQYGIRYTLKLIIGHIGRMSGFKRI
jgi:lipopolysaccharide biosynthesis glycosyltransferase